MLQMTKQRAIGALATGLLALTTSTSLGAPAPKPKSAATRPASSPASRSASAAASRPTEQPLPQAPSSLLRRQLALRAVLRQLARPRLTKREVVIAARAAGRCRSELALGPLARLATVSSWEVRRAVARALGDLQRFAAVGLLFKLASDPERRVAVAALTQLGRYPLPNVRRFLVQQARSKVRQVPPATRPVSKGASRSTSAPASRPASAPARPLTRSAAALAALAHHGTTEARLALRQLARQRRQARQALRALRRCKGCGEPRYLLALRDLLSPGAPRRQAGAVRRLARLKRPSLVLPALLHAIDRQQPAVRVAAIDALARHGDPRAEQALLAVVRSRRPTWERRRALMIVGKRSGAAVRGTVLEVLARRDPLRGLALELLAKRPGGDITTATLEIIADRQASRGLRRRALRVAVARQAPEVVKILWARRDDYHLGTLSLKLLKRHYPAELARLQATLPKPLDRRGLLPLMLLSGGFGSSGMLLLTEVAGGDEPWIAGLSGAVLGGATAWLLNMGGELTVSQAGTFGTFGTWGMVSGLTAGLAGELEDDALAWPVLGGQLAGVGAGMLLMRRAGWKSGDLLYTNVTTAQALIAGGGVVLLIHRDRKYTIAQRIGLGVMGGVTPVLALTGAALTSKRVRVSEADTALITGGSVFGLFAGGLAAGTIRSEPSGAAVGGSLLLGEGLGYLASLTASQFVELNAVKQGWLWMSTYAPAAMGGGLGLLVPKLRGQIARGLTLAGASAGLAFGALTTKRLALRQRDVLLTSYGTIHGGVLGGGLPFLLYDDPDGQSIAGGVLLGSFGGLMAGYLTSRLTDITPRTVGIITTGSVAAAAVGGGLALMLPFDERRLASLGGGFSLAGMAGGALAARHLRFSLADHAMICFLSVWGAVAGGFAPALWEGYSERERAGGALFGAGAAVLGSVAISQAVELEGRDVLELGVWSSAGLGLGGGLALVTQRGQRASAALVEGVGAASLAAGALLAPRYRYSWRDALMMTSVTAGGLGHGAVLADLWSATPTTEQRAGGVLLGATGGLLFSMSLAQLIDADPGDVAFSSLSMLAGDAMGAGLGLLAGASQQNTLRAMLGAGLGSWIAGGVYARYTRFSKTDRSLLGFISGMGMTLGAFTPIHLAGGEGFDGVRRSQVFGGMLFGLGASYAAGAIATQYVDLKPGVVPEAMLFAADSSLLGAGLGLMISRDDRVAVGLLQSMGIVGALGGAFVADSTDYSGTDRLLATVTTAYGAWQGLGVAFLAGASDRQVGGAAMAVASLGGMLGAFLGQYLELSVGEVFTAFSGAVWGSYIGVFSAKIAKDEGASFGGRKMVGIAMLAGDVGLSLSVLALSPILKMTGPRIGWINLFGLGGMALATGVSAAFSGEAAQVGTVAGSVAGLVTGVIVTGLLGIDERERARGGKTLFSDWRGPFRGDRRQRKAGETAAPSAYPGVVAQWAPLVQLQPGMDPATGEVREGETQLLVGVRGLLH